MAANDLVCLRRKELIGLIAAVCWALGFVINVAYPGSDNAFFYIAGWILIVMWVWMDTNFLHRRDTLWTLFALIAGPVALLVYFLVSNPESTVCLRCGAAISESNEPCPKCGWLSAVGAIRRSLNTVYASLVDSLVKGPVESSRQTVKQLAIALAAVALLGGALVGHSASPFAPVIRLLWVFSVAAYWVLVAWWVYLDATWRKMDAMPWAILTLVTNIFGLVTYLVIRYPDPRMCVKCGAGLSVGLRICPYCGAEAEPVCPRCQAPVKPDWAFCPSCSAQIPKVKPVDPARRSTISGTVIDAVSGAPIPDAQVKTDSRTEARSTLSDQLGKYILSDLDPKPHVLVASAEGYVSEAKGYTPSPTGPAQLHFSLHPAPSQARLT